jgi:hypothetical protein
VPQNSLREEMSTVRERVFWRNHGLSHRQAGSGLFRSTHRAAHDRQAGRTRPADSTELGTVVQIKRNGISRLRGESLFCLPPSIIAEAYLGLYSIFRCLLT